MKVFQQSHYTTVCGTPSEWDTLQAEYSGADKVSVLDLRIATENDDFKVADLPEGWRYHAMPIQGTTISEQDVDVFRREQRRHGKLIALSTNETRPSLLALTDICRINRTLIPDSDLATLGDLDQEMTLLAWLTDYLERHQTTDQVGEY